MALLREIDVARLLDSFVFKCQVCSERVIPSDMHINPYTDSVKLLFVCHGAATHVELGCRELVRGGYGNDFPVFYAQFRREGVGAEKSPSIKNRPGDRLIRMFSEGHADSGERCVASRAPRQIRSRPTDDSGLE